MASALLGFLGGISCCRVPRPLRISVLSKLMTSDSCPTSVPVVGGGAAVGEDGEGKVMQGVRRGGVSASTIGEGEQVQECKADKDTSRPTF